MSKYEDKVEQFSRAMNLPVNMPFSADLLALRKRLLQEEIDELFIELDSAIALTQKGEVVPQELFENICKETADVQYVLSGFSVSFGIPIEQAFDLTHESNMSKLGLDGKPIFREDGKIMKGPNYHKPDLHSLKQKVDSIK
ncbi:MAG: nucleoside triphosphate pyrophosphohydrolase family protein [Alphaproteobacteria bacterium]|nr:nucleoside triphosphate pyrophosphohydrolase family protein [Alphaproteobacteria bacterium]